MGLLRLLTFTLALAVCAASATGAVAAEKRLALVIGEADYKAKALPTTANDAGLIAQTLQAAGFDVTGARDVDGDSLRGALRDFLDKARAAGPEGVAFVYFAGYGLQFEGENYLVPVEETLTRDSDLPLRAPRLSDYVKPLSSMGLKAAVVVIDAARENPFSMTGQPLAGGLALYEPGANLLLAYNASPGTVAHDGAGPYGPYAHALAEMIRAGGIGLPQVFSETRLRVSEETKGAQIPWNSEGFNSPFQFFERTAAAPPRLEGDLAKRDLPIEKLGPKDGYTAAIEHDTLKGYEDYLAVYHDDPLAKRVRVIAAARREALIWRRTRMENTPEAYWSYLRRYPHGPHAYDARGMLAAIAAAAEPPPAFMPVDFGYPPPPPEEIVFIDRPAPIFYGDPYYAFAPPPPPPLYFLPPPPVEFALLGPPALLADPFLLPVPVFVPVPAYIAAPAYIVPPPQNVIFANIHNAVVFNPTTNSVVITTPQGNSMRSPLATAIGAGVAGAAIGAALPHVLHNRAGLLPGGATPPAGPAALQQNHALPTNLPPAGAGRGLPGAAPAGAGLPAATPLGAGLPKTGAQPLLHPATPVTPPQPATGASRTPLQGGAPHGHVPTTGATPAAGPGAHHDAFRPPPPGAPPRGPAPSAFHPPAPNFPPRGPAPGAFHPPAPNFPPRGPAPGAFHPPAPNLAPRGPAPGAVRPPAPHGPSCVNVNGKQVCR